MKKIAFVLFSPVILVLAASAWADDYVIPDCKLGHAPVNVDRQVAPTDQPFTGPKGMEVRMEFRKPGDNKLSYIVCKLAEDTQLYAFAPGHAWDKPSGNNLTSNDEKKWPIPYTLPKGEKGDKGDKGDTGEAGAIDQDALDRIAAAMVKEEPKKVAVDVNKRGWCGIFATNTRCNVATGILAAGIGVAAKGGGGGGHHQVVSTKPPCTTLPCS